MASENALIAANILKNLSVDVLLESTHPYVLFKLTDIGRICEIKNVFTSLKACDRVNRTCKTKVGKRQISYISYETLVTLLCASRKHASIQLAQQLGIDVCNTKLLAVEQEFVDSLRNVFCTEEIIEQYYIGSFRLDVYFPKYNLAVEFDETYHKYEQQTKKDLERQYTIEQNGITVLRIKETDDILMSMGKIYKMIHGHSLKP